MKKFYRILIAFLVIFLLGFFISYVTINSSFEKDTKEEKRMAERKAVAEAEDLYDDNGKPVPAWRIALSFIVLTLVIVRLVVRCSD